MEKFHDRSHAGRILAEQLRAYANTPDLIVLALPRGGVPVAYEIAKMLAAPLDVLVVRKLGVPGHEELAMGAIGMQDSLVLNQDIIADLHISTAVCDQVIAEAQKELQRREIQYRGERPFPALQDKTVILVDDGIATGASMYAALQVVRAQKPVQIIVTVPVAALSVCQEMAAQVDGFLCLLQPSVFLSVGTWYSDFSQTTDTEVYTLLEAARCFSLF